MKVESTEVTAHVSIGKDTDGGFGLSAVLDVHVAGVSHSEAQELVKPLTVYVLTRKQHEEILKLH